MNRGDDGEGFYSFRDPYIKTIHEMISKHAPCFPIDPDHVSIIDTPSKFYDGLIDGIQNARERVVLSSLYLGTGTQEQKIVDELEKALEREKDLQVVILLDYLRGTRQTSETKKDSSVSMLEGLVKKFGKERVNVSFYHTPNLTGFWKNVLPARVNEIIGVQHMKLYMFDNDMIISGANLSDWYFVDRQDRYMLIKNEKQVIDFFTGLVKTVQSFSYRLCEKGHLTISSPDPVQNNKEFRLFAEHAIRQYFFNQRWSNNLSNKVTNTWVFPTIQMGQVNVRHEQFLISGIIGAAVENSSLAFTSAYFNFTKEYMTDVLTSPCKDIAILTASPPANGFFTAKGISKNIPMAYDTMEQEFYSAVEKNQKLGSIKLYEYMREKWTFHAKGLWLYSPNKQFNTPFLTMIGSSNFGGRSTERDIEAQIILITEDEKLMKRMEEERQNLQTYSKLVTKATFAVPERRIGRVSHFLVSKFFHKFL
ncbi:hypothetical protein C9374_007670 [Naegleria lovaniensis]|uniref:CDP-diacylglycerol--glycerol-3-phosphate 3-phosphatidyltransferase n=1 Tax=Naegleria lovaniensis TaxID=51637 RepID=A0AA88KGA3_NAELO|nr:uncharacterized protein C9374_007670 [Naegleria lovaniensis]KAG2379032.1 hypothetical protein C9374_007670 [Naegleria lovaniensis]